jgi:organic hydroperoxide reductase OsmC/OhrA
MTAPFPHRYTTTVVRTARSRATIEAAPRPALSGAPPAEFDGDPARWSPEHLLLGALGLCFETTFDALAARVELDVQHWRANVDGVVDKTRTGLELTSITIDVRLVVAPDDVERAGEVLRKAQQHCIVSKALKAPVQVLSQISTDRFEVDDELDEAC